MADDRYLKIALSPYLNRELTDFDQIWYTDTNFHFEHGNLTKKNEIFQIQDGGRTPYWKSFLAISQRHIGQFMQISEWRWRITGRYRTLDQSGNFRKFQMAEGRHFENSFISISQSELSDFEQIWYADANFHSVYGYLTKKNRNFWNSRWRTDAILKIVFWLYLDALLAD